MNILSRYGRKKESDAQVTDAAPAQDCARDEDQLRNVAQDPAYHASPSASDSGPRPEARPTAPEPSDTREAAADEALFDRAMHEVHLRSAHLGDVWLVPAHTGGDRQELTYADAEAIAMVCRTFPDAEVIEFRRPLHQLSELFEEGSVP
jgi:hypothetical protein